MITGYRFSLFFLLVVLFLSNGCSPLSKPVDDLYKSWELTGYGDFSSNALNGISHLSKKDQFIITFSKSGRFVAKTRLTSFTGEYRITGNLISMSDYKKNESFQQAEIPVCLNNLDEKLEYKIINSRLVFFSSGHEFMLFKPVSVSGTKAGVFVLIGIMVVLFLVSAILNNSEKDFSQPVKVG